MKFESLEQLIEYATNIGGDRLKDFDVIFNAPTDEPVDNPVSVVIKEGAVSIQSLSDSPVVNAGLDEELDRNVLFVEGYDSVPMSCSTGKVTLLGRTIFTNICEDESGPTIYLNLVLNETHYRNVPFKLSETPNSESDYIMLLNPKTLLPNE